MLQHYTIGTEFFECILEEPPVSTWRTISVVPVAKIPKPMRRVDKLEKTGSEQLVWVKAKKRKDGTWVVRPKGDGLYWPGLDSKTAALAVIRDGCVIGVIRLEGLLPVFDYGTTLIWGKAGIFEYNQAPGDAKPEGDADMTG
jgi:hypothetical protein